MERRIGEIFEYNGEWYQCVEDTECIKCINCCFYNRGHKLCTDEDMGACVKEYRSDAKSICFKKLEKVGEPYMTGNKLIQRYKIYPTTCCINVYGWYYHNLDVKSWTIDIEIKQNKEDMEQEIEYFGDENAKCFNSESIEKNLKPFNLDAAKQGKPVCTRDGCKARIICFDAKFPKTGNIVTLVEKENGEEVTLYYYDDGHCSIGRGYDLMMLPEKKEGWINIYNADTTFYYVDGRVFETKDEAVQEAKEEVEKEQREKNEYIDTIRVEWEE